ncbi:DUF1799 domain-containing protein [Inquilinus sp. CA228]|uniref:DUF1799 domain-containing protein n=1 Tax=Inquilinus sp. CA228 TaxID=3455609 RepID=UPI003F8D3BA2
MAELRSYGVPEDKIAEVARSQQDQAATPVIWPENADSFRWFLDIQTQWVMAIGFGVSMVLGLDYAGAAAAAQMAGIRTTPTMFADMRLMEATARTIMNEARRG